MVAMGNMSRSKESQIAPIKQKTTYIIYTIDYLLPTIYYLTSNMYYPLSTIYYLYYLPQGGARVAAARGHG